MQTAWGWPAVESVHFLGLTLLFGSIVVWDLRLLGMARSVPIAAFHRLVPLAVLGFTINILSGSLFVMAEANQYVYNPAFQIKLLLLALAGLNVLVFYVTLFRRAASMEPGAAAAAWRTTERRALDRSLDGRHHLRSSDHVLPPDRLYARRDDRIRGRLHHPVTGAQAPSSSPPGKPCCWRPTGPSCWPSSCTARSARPRPPRADARPQRGHLSVRTSA